MVVVTNISYLSIHESRRPRQHTWCILIGSTVDDVVCFPTLDMGGKISSLSTSWAFFVLLLIVNRMLDLTTHYWDDSAVRCGPTCDAAMTQDRPRVTGSFTDWMVLGVTHMTHVTVSWVMLMLVMICSMYSRMFIRVFNGNDKNFIISVQRNVGVVVNIHLYITKHDIVSTSR